MSSNGLIAHACNGGVNSTNIVVDGGLQHDVVQTASGQHLQCIHLTGADHVTVENVVFENRAQYDLNIGSPTNTTNILVQNDVMAPACSDQVTQANGGLCGVVATGSAGSNSSSTPFGAFVIRFNTIDGQFSWNFSNGGSINTGSASQYANVEAGPQNYNCSVYTSDSVSYYDEAAYQNPAGTSVACGIGSVLSAIAPFFSAGYPGYDYHLSSCSAYAAGFVPATISGGYPSSDQAGTARLLTSGGTVDAGAYEDC